MMGDYHVRFCERLGLKCPGLLDDTHIYNVDKMCAIATQFLGCYRWGEEVMALFVGR